LYDVNGPNPNSPLINQSFSTFVNINDELGNLLYREEHYASTDANGLITVKMGDGLYTAGPITNFNLINWGVGKYYLVVDFVINGTTSSTAPEQLVTVPYSFYAGNAGNGMTSVIDNGDGTLTFTYANGATYTTPTLAGIQGTVGPAGPVGPPGPQGQPGVAGANGLNALINTTTEPAGANCANGGTKIETGLDINLNGTLDNSEVNSVQTQYVCNGTSSANGQIASNGIPSNVVIFDIPTSSGTFLNWEVPQGVTRIQVECWGAGGSGGQNGVGGGGAYVKSFLTVVPGSVHQIQVGLGSGWYSPLKIGGQSSFDNLVIAYGGNGTPYAGWWNNINAAGGSGIGQIVYNGQDGFLTWYNPGTSPMTISAGGSSPFGGFGADSHGRYANTPGGGGSGVVGGGNGRVIITY
jgi:hypothetical protein